MLVNFSLMDQLHFVLSLCTICLFWLPDYVNFINSDFYSTVYGFACWCKRSCDFEIMFYSFVSIAYSFSCWCTTGLQWFHQLMYKQSNNSLEWAFKINLWLLFIQYYYCCLRHCFPTLANLRYLNFNFWNSPANIMLDLGNWSPHIGQGILGVDIHKCCIEDSGNWSPIF